MQEIPLTQSKIAIVNDGDYEALLMYKWYAWRSPDTGAFYAMRGHGSGMHRLIMDPEAGMQVDHINHDTLDNRRSNLRVVSVRQNRQNHERYRNNTSGYSGVSWSKRDQKWRAYVNVDGKQKGLGSYIDKLEAAEAARQGAIEAFGEYCRER